MTGLLARKLRRDLRGQKGQLAAVTTVLALGVLLFEGTLLSYVNLADTYLGVQDRLALADLHLDVDRVSAADLERVRAAPGVGAAEGRFVVEVPLVVSTGAGEVDLEGRLISIPAGGPALDRLLLSAGDLPLGPGEVLLEKRFAAYHDLGPGDRVRVDLPGVGEPLVVAGVAVSAEYLWVCRDRHDIAPSPAEFGVLWIGRETLGRIATAAAEGLQADLARAIFGGPPDPSVLARAVLAGDLARAAGPDLGDQLLVDVADGRDRATVLAAVRSTFGPQRVVAVTPREELPGVRLLQMDLDSLRGMAIFFPFLFLTVAAFVTSTLQARRVDAETPVIATLMALGLSSRRVQVHYLGHALVVGTVGTVVGVAGGVAVGYSLGQEYARELQLPYFLYRVRPSIAALGVGVGLAVALLSGWFPARRASRLAPALALRPPVPRVGRAVRLARRLLGPAPLVVRLAVRDLLRRPGRSLATALGVAAALVLVLTISALLESVDRALAVQFEEAQAFDGVAFLYAFEPDEALSGRASRIEGVSSAETALSLPARIAAGPDTFEVLLQGLSPGSALLRPVDFEGVEVRPAPGQLVVGRLVARRLGLEIGRPVDVRLLPGGPDLRPVLGGRCDSALGAVAYMDLADLQSSAGLEGRVNTVLVETDPQNHRPAIDGLEALPGLARSKDVRGLREMVDDMMVLTYLLFGSMLVCCVVLAAAILFNTATLSILERQRELGTMRALGLSMGGIRTLVTIQNGLMAVVGLAVGLPFSILAIDHALSLYESDLFNLPFALSARLLATSAVGIVLVLLAAQWPSLRVVARMDLPATVRTRE